jgi:protease-4
VWSGAAAKERRLVDSLGGMADAVAAAKKRAGIPAEESVNLDVVDPPPGGFDLGLGLSQAESTTQVMIRKLLPSSAAAVSEISEGPLTLLPFEVRIR